MSDTVVCKRCGAFARWVNRKAIFKTVKWEEYRNRVIAQEVSGHGWKNN